MQVPRIAWVVLAGYLLFLQPGAFLNDETLQVAGLDVMHRGEYVLKGEYSPGIWDMQSSLWHAGLPLDGTHAPIGSTMLNVLALPFVYLLEALDLLIGLRVAFAAMTLTGLYVAARKWTHIDPRILQSVGLAILAPTFLLPKISPDPFALIGAITIVNILLMTVAAVLLGGAVAKIDSPLANRVTLLFAFATPAFFWAMHLKYHSLSMALVAIAIWAFRRGPASSPKMWFVTTILLGLGIWNQFPHGALVFGSWGLWAIFNRLSLRHRISRYGAAAMGFAVGILPEILERMAKAQLQVRDRFVPIQTPGGGPIDIEKVIEAETTRGYLSHSIFDQGWSVLDAYWQVFVWPTPEDLRVALPILALMPILWYWRPKGVAAWGAWHLVGMIAVMGTGVLSHGGGMDPRQATTLWPFIAVGLVPALANLKLDQRAMLVPAGYLLLLTPLFLIRKIRGIEYFQLGFAGEFMVPLKFAGLGLACWALVRRPTSIVHVCVIFSVLVQCVMIMGPANLAAPSHNAPMIWPMQLLGEFFKWFGYSY